MEVWQLIKSLEIDRFVAEAGSVTENVSVDGLRLSGCSTELTEDIARRPLLRNLRLKNVVGKSSSLSGAVLQNVTVENLRADIFSGFINGCEFDQVILKGKFSPLVIQKGVSAPTASPLAQKFAQALRVEPDDSSWSLDISEAIGDIALRGYAPRRIRRNPTHQAVMTRAQAEAGRWRKIDLSNTTFVVQIEELLACDWYEGVVLVANPAGARFRSQVDGINRLRDAGAALED